MSLVDDARRLADSWPTHCPACGAWLQANGEHVPDCPWPSMPRIVAALEAAERLSEGIRIFNTADPDGILAEIPHPLWQALVAALRGEEAKA